MFRKEIIGALKDKRTVIFIVVILFIMLVDLGMGYVQNSVTYKRQNEEHIKQVDAEMIAMCEEYGGHYTSNWVEHPAFASFLSGRTHGHLPQMLLIWLLPLYILNLYSDRYISEYGRGYTNVLMVRMGRKHYIKSKLTAAFVIPFMVMGGCLLINFALAQILYRRGYTFHGLEVVTDETIVFMITHPNLTYCIYMLMTCYAAGCCGVICQCIAMAAKKYAHTYIAGFLVWMALIIANVRLTVTNLIQPFTAHETDEAVPPLILITVLTAVIISVTIIIKGKRDEL